MVEGSSKKKKLSGHKGALKKAAIIVSVALGVVLIGILLFLLNLPAPDVKQIQSVIGSKGRVEGSALAGSTSNCLLIMHSSVLLRLMKMVSLLSSSLTILRVR